VWDIHVKFHGNEKTKPGTIPIERDGLKEQVSAPRGLRRGKKGEHENPKHGGKGRRRTTVRKTELWGETFWHKAWRSRPNRKCTQSSMAD